MPGIATTSASDYVKPEAISIKNHPELNEKWVQDLVANDPSILGLGNDLVRVGKEVTLPGGGRLDLLFASSDDEDQVWYPVEVQLGRTDPSHIIRAIEYWDLLRTRYAERNHVAVLIAEDITSRFLNVISLLNKSVPIIAIQMQAFKVGPHLTLVFTTVVDLSTRPDEDAGESSESTRADWEKKAASVMPIVDALFEFVHKKDPGFALKYNQTFIQINKNGRIFVSFTPTKKRTKIRIRVPKTPESEVLKSQIEGAPAGLEVKYDEAARGGPSYRVRVDDNAKFGEYAPSIEKLISLGLEGVE